MKKISTLFLAAAIAAPLTLPVAAAASSGPSSGEIRATVSFRTGPSTSSDVIKYLHKGDDVTILDTVNSYWYKARDSGGSVGYVSSLSKYIAANAGGSAGAGSSFAANADIIASVSFRTGPSTDASRIRYLQRGERVQVIGQPNAWWFQVRDAGGTTGYVSSDTQYIHTNAGSAPSGGSSSGGHPASGSAAVEAIIADGMKYLGTPYEYGSNRNTTTTFDCSDLIETIFREGANVILPPDSRQQGAYVKSKGPVVTDWHQLKRGDLMFFGDYKGTSPSNYGPSYKANARISHVALYLGDGKVLQTYSKKSGGVRTDSIAGKHWEYRFLFGGSAL
ncbi:SH3 domain-containing C40 family peptidase [Paenibacillus humicola]|uniref:C40 family peptidase n=1 Tax=Paenibacillus humicola TaxID=3110540 RepID=UPI00237AB760|nr:SH3 domain-containing C40 family peptidase [Paenibacillus humicola]